MNVELLQRVKAHILEDPNRYDQWIWIVDGLVPGEKLVPAGRIVPECGTVACIAGWAIILGNPHSNTDLPGSWSFFIEHKATELLGISDSQASMLFDGGLLFEDAVKGAKSLQDLAQAAARHIDRFIETNGEEV
jgi:hypothetical protein